ncbi:MAG: inositol 2-dehydrogenase [Planctomycetota bacterium]|jgi:myo-inositol 2-dehydrogenase/D-chiro-inositol 1-dehydrogenase|nr:inositol 2-dehydrogenase [Planctomycetota bacterium]
MAKQVRIGVLGAGRIGKVHVRSLCTMVPDAKVEVVSDVIGEAARKLAGEFGVPRASEDYREVLADRNIDAVFVCTSTDTHARIIEEAAGAGKHVFCEKPIALELAKIDKALKAVKENRIILQVGFNRRFDQGNLRLREIMKSGALGTPEMCVINSRDPAPPPMEYIKVSGGIFLDMMIHDFDLARYLLGDEPTEVYACGASLVDKRIGRTGDFDTAMCVIRFAKGALCHIDNSRRAVYGYDQRAEIFGSKGKAYTLDVHNDNTVVALADSFARPPIQNFFLERYLQAYVEEGKAFVECVRKGRAPSATGHDGRVSVVMGYAALKSAKEGRPVKMAEIKA